MCKRGLKVTTIFIKCCGRVAIQHQFFFFCIAGELLFTLSQQVKQTTTNTLKIPNDHPKFRPKARTSARYRDPHDDVIRFDFDNRMHAVLKQPCLA